MSKLSNVIGLIAEAARENNPGVELICGVVETVDPLTVRLNQKTILDSSQLLLTRNVTDYALEMSVMHETEDETAHTHEIQDTYTGGGTSSPTTHRHAYIGRKVFTVHNALKVGETVVLAGFKGGQLFAVLDKKV